jgi:hypothetical protein
VESSNLLHFFLDRKNLILAEVPYPNQHHPLSGGLACGPGPNRGRDRQVLSAW